MLVEKTPPKIQRTLSLIVLLLDIVFFLAMAYYTWGDAVKSTIERVGFICGTRILPIYPLLYLPVLSFIMIAIEDCFVLLKNLKTQTRSDLVFLSHGESEIGPNL